MCRSQNQITVHLMLAQSVGALLWSPEDEGARSTKGLVDKGPQKGKLKMGPRTSEADYIRLPENGSVLHYKILVRALSNDLVMGLTCR